MPFLSSDSLRSPARGSAQAFTTWAIHRDCARPGDVRQYLETVYQLAPQLNLNPDIIAVQSIHETTIDGAPGVHFGPGATPPASVITGDPAQNDLSRDFGIVVAAARAHILHRSLYVNGASVPAGFSTSEDPRWDAAIDAWLRRIASKLADLTNTWARDDDYAEKIARRLNNLERDAIIGRGGPNPPPRPLGRKPYVLVVSGHRSTGDEGDDVERQFTDDLARAYKRTFRAAGYETDWLQEIDQDSDPTTTLGGPTVMVKACGAVIRDRPESLVLMFDLHFNTAQSAVHAIVAHNRKRDDPNTMLSTWFGPGNVSSDIFTNNTLDVRMAEAIARGIASIPGMRLKAAGTSGKAGVMLENESRVGENGSRLGIMATTAAHRDKSVRLTIEHGGTNDADKPDFSNKCAEASLRAVNATLADRIDTGQGGEELPDDENQAGTGADVPVLPAFFFGSAQGFQFNPEGPVSQLWLRTGNETGRFPRLVDVLDDGTEKHFLFTDGSVIVARGNDPVNPDRNPVTGRHRLVRCWLPTEFGAMIQLGTSSIRRIGPIQIFSNCSDLRGREELAGGREGIDPLGTPGPEQRGQRHPGCGARAERVPPLILRATTRWRKLRSAALFVGGTPGSVTKVNRLSRCVRIRAHSLRWGTSTPCQGRQSWRSSAWHWRRTVHRARGVSAAPSRARAKLAPTASAQPASTGSCGCRPRRSSRSRSRCAQQD